MSRLPIIFDCDPGGDDALMLLMAFVSNSFEILGITTVAGNVNIDHVTNNALRVIELAKRHDIRVFAGCPRPILKSPIYASNVHGESGLDGSTMPPPMAKAQTMHAVDFLISTLLNSDREITLSLSGPMTNLAVALVKTPAVASKVREVICMGGSTGKGNITPYAEFNFFVDPHAAHIVLSSGIPLRMIGLNVTHEVFLTEEDFRQLDSMDTAVSKEVSSIFRFEAKLYRELGFDGRVIHDACIVAALLRPEHFEFTKRRVSIELKDEHRIGESILEECRDGSDSHIAVAVAVDNVAVRAFVMEVIRSY